MSDGEGEGNEEVGNVLTGGEELPPDPAVTPAETVWNQFLHTTPEPLRASLTNVKSVEDMATQFHERGKLIGKKGIIPPNVEDQADVTRFYRELGVPEKVEDYDLGGFTAPEDIGWDNDLQTNMLNVMHEANLDSKQVSSLMTAYAKIQQEQVSGLNGKMQEITNQADADLRQDWGQKYDANKNLAGQAARELLGDDVGEFAGLKMADGRALGNHPAVVKLFAKIGESMGEHPMHGEKMRVPVGHTPEEAASEISKLRMDKGFMDALTDGQHLEHNSAVKRLEQLYIEKDGEELVPDAPTFG